MTLEEGVLRLTSSPLGNPLEPGPEAATIAAPQVGRLNGRNLCLVDSAPATSEIDRLHEMCHDMRQPVASILVLADAALSDASIPSAVRTRLEEIQEQADWLGELLQHLLGAHHATTPDGRSHDLTQIASDVVRAERATYGGDLRLHCSGGDMRVRGNAVELRRAVANLLSNGTRAAGPDGRVVVELHSADEHVLLTVDDDGPGFGLIRRGTGLGLRVAASSLKSYGGRIEYSRGQMGGARASLVLRAASS